MSYLGILSPTNDCDTCESATSDAPASRLPAKDSYGRTESSYLRSPKEKENVPVPPQTAIPSSIQAQAQDHIDDCLGEVQPLQVFVRLRPLLHHEVNHQKRVLSQHGATDITINAAADRIITCRYDRVYGAEARQENIYSSLRSLALRVLNGYNTTIMAYGQTGSGKTYTMFGPPELSEDVVLSGQRDLPKVAGVIPRAVFDVFVSVQKKERQGQQITVYCSFLQIYNEHLYDMLRDSERGNPLNVHEERADVYVQGLSEFMVKTPEECLALLKIGEENRAVRETRMNQASSRSHSVFQLLVEQERPDTDGSMRLLRSKLNLIDLAGSEKWDTRHDISSPHINELTNINSSLFTLGRCIAALSAKTPTAHIPFRESKLTRLIQDSLGGNTRTCIIATLSPTQECVEETISTLRFADRAKQVMTYVRQSEKPIIDHALLRKLQREVSQLRAMVLRLKRAKAEGSGEQGETGGSIQRALKRIEALEAQLMEERRKSDELAAQVKSLEGNMAAAAASKPMRKPEAGFITPERRRSVPSPTVSAPFDLTNSEPELVKLDHLRYKLEQAEDLNSQFVGLLSKFFSFEIEEGALRRALGALVPDVDKFMLESPMRLMRPRQIYSPGTEKISARSPDWQPCRNSPASHPAASWDKSPVKDGGLVRPKASRGSVINVAYRIRDKAENSGQALPTSVQVHEEERKLIEQLQQARKRMQRHVKLQEWLLKKEQKDVEAAEREQQVIRAQDQARRDSDSRFRERARRQKRRLHAYYASLRRDAENESSAMPGRIKED